MGDIVEVQVDRASNKVRYLVNGIFQAEQINSMLTEREGVFVPFVGFYHQGDTVEWIE